jgi:hypothetical protein
MDQVSQDTLAEIARKEPASLTEADIAFLQARRSYLNEEQRAVFADVLGATEPEPEEESAEEPAKKGKKAKSEE